MPYATKKADDHSKPKDAPKFQNITKGISKFFSWKKNKKKKPKPSLGCFMYDNPIYQSESLRAQVGFGGRRKQDKSDKYEVNDECSAGRSIDLSVSNDLERLLGKYRQEGGSITDSDGKLLEMRHSIEKYTNISSEDILGKEYCEKSDPENQNEGNSTNFKLNDVDMHGMSISTNPMYASESSSDVNQEEESDSIQAASTESQDDDDEGGNDDDDDDDVSICLSPKNLIYNIAYTLPLSKQNKERFVFDDSCLPSIFKEKSLENVNSSPIKRGDKLRRSKSMPAGKTIHVYPDGTSYGQDVTLFLQPPTLHTNIIKNDCGILPVPFLTNREMIRLDDMPSEKKHLSKACSVPANSAYIHIATDDPNTPKISTPLPINEEYHSPPPKPKPKKIVYTLPPITSTPRLDRSAVLQNDMSTSYPAQEAPQVAQDDTSFSKKAKELPPLPTKTKKVQPGSPMTTTASRGHFHNDFPNSYSPIFNRSRKGGLLSSPIVKTRKVQAVLPLQEAKKVQEVFPLSKNVRVDSPVNDTGMPLIEPVKEEPPVRLRSLSTSMSPTRKVKPGSPVTGKPSRTIQPGWPVSSTSSAQSHVPMTKLDVEQRERARSMSPSMQPTRNVQHGSPVTSKTKRKIKSGSPGASRRVTPGSPILSTTKNSESKSPMKLAKSYSSIHSDNIIALPVNTHEVNKRPLRNYHSVPNVSSSNALDINNLKFQNEQMTRKRSPSFSLYENIPYISVDDSAPHFGRHEKLSRKANVHHRNKNLKIPLLSTSPNNIILRENVIEKSPDFFNNQERPQRKIVLNKAPIYVQ